MGAFLDKPKTEKEGSCGTGNGLRYGLSSMQGWRVEMEDAHCAVVGLPHGLDEWSFFAVFDGHAGARVSAHCAQNLLDSIIQFDEFVAGAATSDATDDQMEKVKTGIRNGFLQLDEKMKELPEVLSGEDKSGSTAVSALISATHIFMANCGDSRAVLSRAGSAFFSTADHKPVNPQEKERIVRAGGSVLIQRVNGSLAVSRALGDYEYKQVEGKGPCEQLVSPEPEITVIERDALADEFLCLACDGIWDVLNNAELCDFVRYLLTIQPDVQQICSAVIDVCLHKGSKDNMSVVLVVFPGAPPVSPEALAKDAQLDQLIETKITEILSKNNELVLNALIQTYLPDEDIDWPPGAGLEAKRALIERVYHKLSGSTEK